MNILATQYSLEHKALEIYISGCKGNPKCSNCHNPESWDFNQGSPYKPMLAQIRLKLEEFDSMIDKIVVLGGEPLDQSEYHFNQFCMVLEYFRYQFNKELWLFTRYEMYEIPTQIINTFDYIKCGRYDETLLVDDNIQYGYKLASSNQQIHNVLPKESNGKTDI